VAVVLVKQVVVLLAEAEEQEVLELQQDLQLQQEHQLL
jgi:hypothetical protein